LDGQRSHRLARTRSVAVLPEKTEVTVLRLDLVRADEDRITLSLDCSAGFYVRSLAHDLGLALGTGAHLEQLQRTRSGDFTVDVAIDLATAEQDRDRARAAVIPLASMLPGLRAAVLTLDGVRHAIQGRDLGPADFSRDVAVTRREPNPAATPASPVRLLHPGGELIGIAAPIEDARTPGLLHPFVILM